MTESNNKLNFVFNSTQLVDSKIHGTHINTSFFNTLKQLNLVKNVFYTDNIPMETFVYEYVNRWIHTDYFEFFGKNGFLELEPCPENVIKRIREKTAFLLITIPYESPLQHNKINVIHEYLKKHKLPSSQVICLTCCLNGHELYKKYCDNISEPQMFKISYAPTYFSIFSNKAYKLFPVINKKYQPFLKKKDFLLFNRRWHTYRILFLYKIYKKNIIDNFYISFSKTNPQNNISYKSAIKECFVDFLKKDELLDIESVDKIESMLPFILDVKDFTKNLMFDEFNSTLDLYKNSFIHIINESFFDSDVIHLTEKTFKPILFKQPFILMGPPMMLSSIKKLGFRTFNEVWDESYDGVYDHSERLEKILQLCYDISKWKESDKLCAMTKCIEIVEHNFLNLLRFKTTKPIVNDIINNCFNLHISS